MRIYNRIAWTLVGGILAAQEPAKVPEPSDQGDVIVFRQENAFVMAPVIVRDRGGHIVNGLTLRDFALYDNRRKQEITEDTTSHPVSLVVGVQASANMEKLLPSIRGIGSLFSALVVGETGEMALLSFDHRVQTLTDFTSDPDRMSDAFGTIKSGSSRSHLNDAAMQGVQMLRNRDRSRRRVLMLISETRDDGSLTDVRDVLTEAELRDVTVYAVEVSHLITSLNTHPSPPRSSLIPPEARQLPSGVVATKTTEAQGLVCCSPPMGDFSPLFKEIFTAGKAIFVANPQEVYTKFTGGREYPYVTRQELEQAITDIGEEIRGQYLLTYLPSNPDEAGYHEIEVRVLKPGFRVTTRPGYWTGPRGSPR